MIFAGDKVKINIEALDENGIGECLSQENAYKYILEHPDEIYTVLSTDGVSALASIKLSHEIVGITSFFEDELIKVGESL